jgi:hypothetical protein
LDTPLKSNARKKVSIETQKLSLEIQNLRKQNRWWVQLLPLIATVVGVAGFFFTVVQFQSQRTSEQRKDRLTREVDQRTKFQNQIRGDIEELLRFTRDQSQTVSRVGFLLEDVKTVMESYVNESQKVSDLFPGYKRSLTESLVTLVRDDCDFTKNPRDVELANTIIIHWDDYSNYLKEKTQKLDYILYEYTRGLQALHDKNPGYFKNLDLKGKPIGYYVPPKYRKKANEAILFGHFLDIVDGFKLHLEVLGTENLSDAAKELRDKNRRDFQDAVGNRRVSEYILGTYFEPQLKESKCLTNRAKRMTTAISA